MTTLDNKTQIERSITAFSERNFRENGIHLLKSLGYSSDRQVSIEPNTFEGFVEIHPPLSGINKQKALVENWLSVDILFQLTGQDLKQITQGRLIFDKHRIDNQIIESYLFLAIELKLDNYSRTKLADVTREVNRFFAMPVMILFKYGEALTLSIINRRLHKKDESKDVLDKVTLIKGINIKNPIRAHVEILFDLSLPELEKSGGMHSFVELHNAWQKTLDISELNKRFYREIADWYFFAVEHVEFPKGTNEDRQTRNATNIIRLITRLIFVWFIKEKGLVPDTLFNLAQLKEILQFNDPQSSTYYKAILQNLFFATLNTEMGPERRFRGKNKNPNGLDAHHGISTVYRYEDFFRDPAKGLALFVGIPFLNGGLFECLDKRDEKILVDGFSDDPRNQPVVPDSLFFGDELTVDLSEVYGDKHHNKEKVRGLIRIFDSYKFTIEENTPLDEEIALDPELLGKVFENLLAAYNPETGTTARKQTGSFYTPREIVNYMVDESLIAYLENSLGGDKQDTKEKSLLESNLRDLLAYNNDPHKFTGVKADQIISAIDKVKVLDPACGSGAFPMGVLHKLVFILNKLDPGNGKWKERQLAKASEIPDSTVRDQVIEDIEKSFSDNELDYGRKLYLIENCIYGVDIQPIAVQIAKLRFFISLVVDQKTNRLKPNLGIRPLPNLESKFVAANTLIGIEKPQQMFLHNQAIDEKEKRLSEVRDSLFTARTPATKHKYRELDKQLREEIADLLKNDGWSNDTSNLLAQWDPYNQNSSAEFFDTEWMFGINNGFDVIIGNPPYISHDKIVNKLTLQKQYESYEPFADIYCYFIEKAIKLQNPNGIMSFITSNSFLRAEYGAPLRRIIRKQNVLLNIVNLEDAQVFESAIVNVAVIITSRKISKTKCVIYNSPYTGSDNFSKFIMSKSFFYDQNVFDSKSWSLIEPEKVEIQQKLEKQGKTLEQLGAKIRLGLATGNNDAFVIGEDKRNEFITENPKNLEIIKPILRGRDIFRFHYKLPNLYILLTKNGINVQKDYPEIYKYLDSFGASFKNRGAQGQHWTNLRATAFFDDFKEEKIVWIELSDIGRFALCTDEIYLLNSAYFLLPPPRVNTKYLLGLLNSRLICFYLGLIAETSGMGTNRWINNYVKEFPIVVPAVDKQNEVAKLVTEILLTKHADPQIDTYGLEIKIDRIVYELYELTDNEIAIIEENSSVSKIKNLYHENTSDVISDGIAESEVINPSLQSDYDLYKCNLCGKLVIGHDRESHSREFHHNQVEWVKLK